MELARINEGVKALNGLGVKGAKVKVAKDDAPEILAKKFMEAVGKIPESSEIELEEKHKEEWDILCAVALEAKEFLVEGTKKVPVLKSPKKEKGNNKLVTAKPTKILAKKKTPVELSRYGHRVGSEAATLDDLFFKGTTLKAAAEVIKNKEGRVRSHIQHLRVKKDVVVESNDKGLYKVKA